MEFSNFRPPNELDATSTRLLNNLASQDPDAWRQLVELYGPVVRFWIKRQGLQKNDLADVFQDVFLAVSKSLARFEKQEGIAKFRSWLKTVTHSKITDFFRRNGKQEGALGGSTAMAQFGRIADERAGNMEVEQASVEFDQEDADLLNQRRLKIIRDEFREKTWNSFWRMVVDGRTSQEVAEELGITAVAVRKNKSRVMARIRQEFDEQELQD